MMDPLENDLFDIPDYEHTEDEDFPPLPPPHSPGADDAGDMENGDDWTKNMGQSQPEEAPKPARRAVKRPQPKLDGQRLTSQRGLPALRHLFDNVKFKGKGHETEDLRVLLRQMENWAHRLFPKLQFEDFLNRLEALGAKKEVQTCLKRIRMDLPIIHEDFTSDEAVAPPPPASQTPPADPDEIPEDFDENLLEEVDRVVESTQPEQPASSQFASAAEDGPDDTTTEVQND
ncbi:TIMELESS-interacting protein [Gastrophryne carolinensis]